MDWELGVLTLTGTLERTESSLTAIRLGLRWKDLDFERGFVVIRSTLFT